MRQVTNERSARKRNRRPQGRSGTRTDRAKAPARKGAQQRKPENKARLAKVLRAARAWLARPRPFLFLFLALAGVVMLAGLASGGYVSRAEKSFSQAVTAFAGAAGFGIEDVRVAGNLRTPAKTVASALALESDRQIFAVDLYTVRRRLLALPWIKEAEVRREFPHAIAVNIVEKQPFALWQSDKGLFVIERSGAVITANDVVQFAKLPKLLGAGANDGAEIVDAIRSHHALAAHVAGIERIHERRWNLILDDGITVDLPENGWPAQLDVLEHLIADNGVLERSISEIDLRSPTHYFFTVKPAPKKDDGGKQI